VSIRAARDDSNEGFAAHDVRRIAAHRLPDMMVARGLSPMPAS
jgi:hypothetical protein